MRKRSMQKSAGTASPLSKIIAIIMAITMVQTFSLRVYAAGATYAPEDSAMVDGAGIKDIVIGGDAATLNYLIPTLNSAYPDRMSQLQADLTAKILELANGSVSANGIRVRGEGVVSVSASDLSDWFVYKHYGNTATNGTGSVTAVASPKTGVTGAYTGTGADAYYNDWFTRVDTVGGSGRQLHPYTLMSATTESSVPGGENNKLYALQDFVVNANGLAGLNANTSGGLKPGSNGRHLREYMYSYENTNKLANMLFMGYTNAGATDFAFFPSQSPLVKTIEFNIDLNDVKSHPTTFTGFLINTGIDSSGNIQGYFVNLSNISTTAVTVNLRKINANTTPAALMAANGIEAVSAQIAAATNTATALKEDGTGTFLTRSHWKIAFDDNKLSIDISKPDSNGGGTGSTPQKLLFGGSYSSGGDGVLSTGFYGFGPFASNTSHGCADVSAVKYTDIDMYFKVDAFTNIKQSPYNTLDTSDRFFINLTQGAIDPSTATDYWEGVGRMRTDQIFYVTNSPNSGIVGSSTGTTVPGSTIAGPHNGDNGHVTTNHVTAALTAQQYDDYLTDLANYILHTTTANDWHENKLTAMGGNNPTPGIDIFGVDDYTKLSAGKIIENAEWKKLAAHPINLYALDKSVVVEDCKTANEKIKSITVELYYIPDNFALATGAWAANTPTYTPSGATMQYPVYDVRGNHYGNRDTWYKIAGPKTFTTTGNNGVYGPIFRMDGVTTSTGTYMMRLEATDSAGHVSTYWADRQFEVQHDNAVSLATIDENASSGNLVGGVKGGTSTVNPVGTYEGTSVTVRLNDRASTADADWGVIAYRVDFGSDINHLTYSSGIIEFPEARLDSVPVYVPNLKQRAQNMFIYTWDWAGNVSITTIPIAPYTVTVSKDNVVKADLSAMSIPTDYTTARNTPQFYAWGAALNTPTAIGFNDYTTGNTVDGWALAKGAAAVSNFSVSGDMFVYPHLTGQPDFVPPTTPDPNATPTPTPDPNAPTPDPNAPTPDPNAPTPVPGGPGDTPPPDTTPAPGGETPPPAVPGNPGETPPPETPGNPGETPAPATETPGNPGETPAPATETPGNPNETPDTEVPNNPDNPPAIPNIPIVAEPNHTPVPVNNPNEVPDIKINVEVPDITTFNVTTPDDEKIVTDGGRVETGVDTNVRTTLPPGLKAELDKAYPDGNYVVKGMIDTTFWKDVYDKDGNKVTHEEYTTTDVAVKIIIDAAPYKGTVPYILHNGVLTPLKYQIIDGKFVFEVTDFGTIVFVSENSIRSNPRTGDTEIPVPYIPIMAAGVTSLVLLKRKLKLKKHSA